MEERASIRPGLPPQNPTVSYWQDPPSRFSNHRTTSKLPGSVDTLIIGSGITGATLAYRILSQPSPPEVLVLEARTACSGATGRNGGHTKCAAYRQILDNIKDLGEEEAAKIARFGYNCMRNVHAFAREHAIECDSWQGDTVDVIYDQGQWNKAQEAVVELKRVLGAEDPVARYRFWDAEEAEKKFLAQGSLGAISYEAGSLSAYKFVIGVLALALEKGLNLQTETPALKIRKRENGHTGWIVETPRGAIEAKRLVLATNGYTAHLYPQLQGVIVPLRGHMTAQRPGSGLPKDGLATTYSFIYDDGYEYMIPRPQGSVFAGDIMIGGGLTKGPDEGIYEYGTTDDTTTDAIILEYVTNSAAGRFGSNWGHDNSEGRLRRAWTGIMGYSSDGFPLIGQMPGEDDLYIAASFQGLGMVLCFESTRALCEIMTKDDGALDQWFPQSFRVTRDRMKRKFRGRLHAKVPPMDLEMKTQS
ncbi:hypothetical protein IMSHALPRED_008524 [Imshaugia aleurites]|uniref:FAD dependent oxidoreductase domain-containing protein n=1 Tax=Imshaugia aleurites TaxID=172621 RepID=A0A8H3ENP4_9LECA|nr:hypothetical protein IMSHALPRED_008524 [Imshaugia aleurites]